MSSDAPREVKDRPAENGIRLSNALLTVAVLILGWMASNIDLIKDQLSTLSAVAAANQAAIEAQRHINDRQDREIDGNRHRISEVIEQLPVRSP